MLDYSTLIESLGKDILDFSLDARYLNRTDFSKFEGNPLAVAYPKDESQIREILKFAKTHKLSLTARGMGTSFVGSSVALKNSLVLNFKNMNRILKINKTKKLAFVQPGVLTQTLIDEVQKYNLYYPINLTSRTFATIGGNLAMNSSGLNFDKYGITSDFIAGLKYLDNNGSLKKTGIYGTDNIFGELLIGSEGTLGIITEICLKLIPLPIVNKTFLVFFDRFEEALEFGANITREIANISSLEIFDKKCNYAFKKHQKSYFRQKSGASLLIKIDNLALALLEKQSLQIENFIKKDRQLTYFKFEQDDLEAEKLWQIRENIHPILNNIYGEIFTEDVVVPLKKVKLFLKILKRIQMRYNKQNIVIYTQGGSGHFYLNTVYNKKIKGSKHKALLASDEIYKAVIKLGGVISGAHGIGLIKKNFLGKQYSQNEIALLKKIKSAFDPTNTFNSGKIINPEPK